MTVSNTAIVLSAEPRGVFKEGIVSGTPKPGTIMQIKESTEPVGGKHTWEVFDADENGSQRLIAVLLEDSLQGKTVSDAYVDGDQCFLYCPIPGDELNVLLENQVGTSDSFAIGDLLRVEDGTGKLLATSGTPESEPFVVMETLSAITADSLCHVMFTGY